MPEPNGTGTDTGTTTQPAGEGAASGVDWESDDNPYKKRFAGEQAASQKLRTENDQLRTQVGQTDMLNTRLSTVEDLLADLADRSATPRGSSFGGDDDDDSAPVTTNRDALRNRRAQLETQTFAAAVQQTYNRIVELWEDGMDNDDPAVIEVRTLYNQARQNPQLKGNLAVAEAKMDAYRERYFRAKAEAAAAAAPSPDDSKNDASNDGSAGSDGSGEGAQGDGDNNPFKQESQSKRERMAAQPNMTEGQGGDGAAGGGNPPPDWDNMTGTEIFAKDHEERRARGEQI